jgi:hypothetical protein
LVRVISCFESQSTSRRFPWLARTSAVGIIVNPSKEQSSGGKKAIPETPFPVNLGISPTSSCRGCPRLRFRQHTRPKTAHNTQRNPPTAATTMYQGNLAVGSRAKEEEVEGHSWRHIPPGHQVQPFASSQEGEEWKVQHGRHSSTAGMLTCKVLQ